MTAALLGPTIRTERLAKQFGPVQAVAEVSLTARPGRVTGFVGPNGAGKSTTLRMLTGLIRPDSGSATVDGRNYRDLSNPARVLGVVLDIAAAHPGLTARNHLRTQAALAGVDRSRVDAVLGQVELTAAADRRVGGFSTGMRQRLALATALLGEPAALLLDEPANGLDPAGILWLRTLLRGFADHGGTVLVSSHVLTELQQVIDDLVLIEGGRTRWSGTLPDFTASYPSLEDAYFATLEGAA